MASIIKVKDKWRVQVRRKGHPAECRTFPTKAQAVAWARQRETDIDRGVPTVQGDGVTVAQLIRAYRKLRDQARPISDTSNEHYVLRTLERLLGHMHPARMTPDDLAAFGAARRDEGAGPYTINCDLSKLGTVLRYGAASLRVSLPDVVGAARPLMAHLRLIGGGGKRERRPADDELTRLLDYLREHRGVVYADAVEFAAASAMRRGEITELRADDVDTATRVASVWRKHPRLGKRLHRVPIMPAAWAVLMRQTPAEDGRYFPIHPQTLTKYVTQACAALGIVDLHLHDMRHEGTSRLFEQGYSVPEVAMVTGHASLAHLSRYTQLRAEDVAGKGRAVSDTPAGDG